MDKQKRYIGVSGRPGGNDRSSANSSRTGRTCESPYNTKSLVSIIAPCYNEVDNILPFIQEINEVMGSNGKYSYEIVIVDDGSKDGSREVIHKTEGVVEKNVRGIYFARNFGQQAALLAGVCEARGDVLITMDIDGQHPVWVIAPMLSQWETGCTVVYALPENSTEDNPLKKWISGKYNRFMRWFRVVNEVQSANDFRLFDREVAEVILSLPSQNLYFRGLFSWLCPLREDTDDQTATIPTWKAGKVLYRMEERRSGKSKYSFVKLSRLALNGITSRTVMPLRVAFWIAMAAIVIAIILAVQALYSYFIVGNAVQGWTSLTIVILFFTSIQFLVLGIMGEYIANIVVGVRRRPPYITTTCEYSGNQSVEQTSDSLLGDFKKVNQ